MQNAIAIVVLIVGGIAAGTGLRGRDKLVRTIDHAALGAVFVLLFLLGLDLGTKEEVFSKIGSVGLEAVVISLAAMIGSVAATSVVWVIWFRKDGP